jgi:lysyl-tRNA synthetase class 1
MASPRPTWVEEVADDVVAFVATRGKIETEPIVCASGISPSGPIHLGNLREVVTAHAVAEEVARRGRNVRHLHFWDDYDRLRRVPQSVPASFEEYVGWPLCDIPDPGDHCHSSYAAHFASTFDDSLDQLRIRPEQVFQSAAYRDGTYAEGVSRALLASDDIAEVLRRHQTQKEQGEPSAKEIQSQLPLRIYCENCHRDFTDVAVESSSGQMTYRCNACGYEGDVAFNRAIPGKLVWKVDWPMRWAHYQVDFEPGGVDHSSPGSSYEVGAELVQRVFGTVAPLYVGYSFVGIEGRSKMSSSHGDVPTPEMALRVLEPTILRWQYIRRQPRHSFNISFGSEVLRLYDEYDGLRLRVNEGRSKPNEHHFYEISVRSSAGEVSAATLPLPFRMLASAADVTQGERDQLFRVVRDYTGQDLSRQQLEQDVEPRLSCAIDWALSFQPDDERTRIRSQPATPGEVTLAPHDRLGVAMLLDGLDEHWSLDGLTALVYGVPKVLAGTSMDSPTNDSIKSDQRHFFKLLYELLIDADTGPRLPTLLLSLGRERIEYLLSPFAKE